jgi:hypothetical protein
MPYESGKGRCRHCGKDEVYVSPSSGKLHTRICAECRSRQVKFAIRGRRRKHESSAPTVQFSAQDAIAMANKQGRALADVVRDIYERT